MENKLNILLVEDEDPAAERLMGMLEKVLPQENKLHHTVSVADSLEWLRNHQRPDLVFLDINLSDGTGFDVLSQSGITSPVIFTTAYDQYALEAFKVHSIDYLLKPIRQDELQRAFDKFMLLRNNHTTTDYSELLRQLGHLSKDHDYLKRLIIRVGSKLKTVEASQIAYISSRHRMVSLTTGDGAHYSLDQTLDELEKQLDVEQFFRINRSMIIHVKAIQQMMIWTKSRLKLELNPPYDEDVLVSYEKTAAFRQWLTGKS